MAKSRSRKRVGRASVAVVMGSDSDWPIMKLAVAALKDFGISFEKKVISAHRTPREMVEFALSARTRGIEVIIAGAGGSAHLPGMIASLTSLPVIGVPIPTKNLDGLDSLLSIVQMPKGVPVATVAIGGGYNAGLLAVQILSISREALGQKLQVYKQKLRAKVFKMKI